MVAMWRSLVVARRGTIQDPEAAGASGPAQRAGSGKAVMSRRAAAEAGGGASAGASTAAEGGAAARAAADRSTIEMVERAVFLHHPYESRERLRRVLPRETDIQALDRALERLERSGKIAIDGEAIRWVGGLGPGVGNSAQATGGKSILAGTRFEWMEEDKLPTETVGEYIVRIYNAYEPGSYTAKDAKEFDEGMRSMAKGDYYTHEQVWKEFGP